MISFVALTSPGERIRVIRKQKRIRQKALANMIGISSGSLTNFEKGRRPISLEWLQRIANALDVPISYFLPDNTTAVNRTILSDPRERRLLNAWRRLGKSDLLRRDFLQLLDHLGQDKGIKRLQRKTFNSRWS